MTSRAPSSTSTSTFSSGCASPASRPPNSYVATVACPAAGQTTCHTCGICFYARTKRQREGLSQGRGPAVGGSKNQPLWDPFGWSDSLTPTAPCPRGTVAQVNVGMLPAIEPTNPMSLPLPVAEDGNDDYDNGTFFFQTRVHTALINGGRAARDRLCCDASGRLSERHDACVCQSSTQSPPFCNRPAALAVIVPGLPNWTYVERAVQFNEGPMALKSVSVGLPRHTYDAPPWGCILYVWRT